MTITEDGAKTTDQVSRPAHRISVETFSHARVFGIGAALGGIGLAVSGSALFAAIRHRMRQMDVPPRELVRQKWTQTKAATAAGADAWRKDAKNLHGR